MYCIEDCFRWSLALSKGFLSVFTCSFHCHLEGLIHTEMLCVTMAEWSKGVPPGIVGFVVQHLFIFIFSALTANIIKPYVFKCKTESCLGWPTTLSGSGFQVSPSWIQASCTQCQLMLSWKCWGWAHYTITHYLYIEQDVKHNAEVRFSDFIFYRRIKIQEELG